MSLKPVLVVIPQRTLRFLSVTRLASTECPPVLVAKKQGGVCQLEGPPPRTTNGEEEEEEEEGGGASEEEGTRFDDVTNMVPSRAVKHKAVEKKRKKKISEAIQQILEILRPPSPTGKLTRADILEIAVDKIKTLKEENEALKSKIEALPEPAGALELSGVLSKHILEYVTLRTQLQRHIEQRQQLSCDQMTESHDSVQRQTVVDNDSEEMCAPSQIVVPSSSSLNDLSMGEAASCNVRTRVASPSVANASTSIGNEHNTIVTEAPPLSQEAPPTNQPWPVTSILSRVSNCRYTGRNEMPVGCHGDISGTNRATSSSPAVQRVQPIGLSLPPVSMSSALAPPTSYLHNEPSSTVTCSTRISSVTSTSGSQRRNIQTQLRNSRNVTSSSTHVRSESELGTRHAHYHHHRQHAQQRHHSRDGYHRYTPDTGEYYDPPTALQPNTPSIVQPWVESHQRPRLHHMTKTTPTVSPSSHYPLQHHHHDHSRHGNHSERFMPYPSTAGRANIHNTSTFSSGSWSHGHHVTTAGSSSGVGQNIAPLGGTYASMYGSHYHPQHQHHFTPHPSGGVSTDYSNYSLSQGHLPPFYQTQHSTVRSSNMMSHDSAATPPYPIQPHPHTGSNSSTAVWRPYSERSRLSGFYLSDILSLPSEPEAPPLQMEPTPPTGHRGIQSFQVNRLLEDI